MKTLMLILILTLAGVSPSLANLGDTEKQLRARFGTKPTKIVEFTNTGGKQARGLVYKEGAKTVVIVLLDGISSCEFFFPEPSEHELSAMKVSYSEGHGWNSSHLDDTMTSKRDDEHISIYDTRNKGGFGDVWRLRVL
jgi:hypothetical protein